MLCCTYGEVNPYGHAFDPLEACPLPHTHKDKRCTSSTRLCGRSYYGSTNLDSCEIIPRSSSGHIAPLAGIVGTPRASYHINQKHSVLSLLSIICSSQSEYP